MAKKGKQKQRDRERRRQATAAKRAKKRQGRSTSRPAEVSEEPTLSIDAPRERTLPPVFADTSGALMPDPRALLGIGDEEVDAERIRRAYRAALEAHPPEAEPELARQIREARDLLVDPERVFERELGVLRAPDPAAWGLGAVIPGVDLDQLDVEARLAGQVALYALVEDALTNQEPPR